MEKSMISLCLLGGLAIGNGFAQTPSKPNILLIIADDCSYYDIGCFGAVNNKTPHIDALARQGIKYAYPALCLYRYVSDASWRLRQP